MKLLALASILLAAGCASSAPLRETAALPRALCSNGDYWDGNECVERGAARQQVDEATAALAAFDVDAALPLLEAASRGGPHDHDLLIDLYEQLGIAHSYLKDEKKALAAFEMLLTLDPGHLLSYTLSPQATFLYERARKANDARAETLLDVRWPQNLRDDRKVPLTVSVVSDPKAMLASLTLRMRLRGDTDYRQVSTPLPAAGATESLVLPAPRAGKASVLQVYGSGYDAQGNEVLRWFSHDRPRDLAISYRAPTPWYRKWWVWAAIGGGAAVATGATVYVLGLEPPDFVGGDFSFGR